ncbi:putative DsbA family dithiol-disulfide isomerase [Halohasta litchfieldiae]|uniref:Predicted dithiol-disulfide isomerase, DsbA family n=1 Tax=Halohasta litchfieldiae TaxID=1073996 RepID=A0A1H6XMK1_9EURY|nr:DsbA family oxidoreductase [Halohasta litchfieldiae]ATW90158.1 putative DsbA family dithiol-disulfide isomerase [Halohasta litchfieldiae]SEJ30318.1 Predicted dithiol-disulfide isomerase, DsbA family [Halohasta litchfieldiae]
MSTSQSEPITVYSDYVCPFCYLGRESLSRYQERRDEELAINWQPFDLRRGKRNPDGTIDHSVDDGKDDDYYAQAKESVRRLQEKYDVDMTLELATDVDSFNAQIASYYVAEHYPYETWLDFDVAIFEALWEDGRDIGDEDVLADLAEAVGVDPEEIRDALDDETLREQIEAEWSTAQQQGVTGVPTFAYEGYSARGAVPPEQLQRLVEGVN